MSKLTKALTAAAGNAGESLYVEDVFSTYLYTGNATARSITNGIDLAGEGGLVWTKSRSSAEWHHLVDTERGSNKALYSNSTAAEATGAYLTAFNSDGYSLNTLFNSNATDYASWTFRKAEKFFDVVTYTGNGVAGRNIAHNLGSVPGMIIVKNLDVGRSWNVYHRKLDATSPEGYALKLNSTAERQIATTAEGGNSWNSTAPTDAVFTLGEYNETNENNQNFVAYLFASDAGGFGDDGSENIIKCGSYTGTGSAGLEVNLGFEPQWILVKGATSGAAYDWYLVDNMRGITTGGNDPLLWPNKSDAEDTASNIISVTATGFKLEGTGFGFNRSGETYIYIAIRRPMKTPESGTEVFAINDNVASDSVKTTSGITTDVFWERPSYNSGATGQSFNVSQRLTRTVFQTQSTAAEGGPYGSGYLEFDYMDGFLSGLAGSISPGLFYSFKRATGFFDVVAYTGDGVGGRAVAHNLGVAPELMIVKRRDSSESWSVYSAYNGLGFLFLNTTSAYNSANIFWNNTSPSNSTFTVSADGGVNVSGGTYVAYLFASVAGVSKVGSYTGTGSNVDVDCGFSAGARFILIKRTDSTGDWYVWDSVRGIVAGNDPYLLLNTTAAEVTSTDYIDPLSSGFTVTSSAPAALNASGGTYIFLAIA